MNNGLVIRDLQGSRKDFVGAWIMRALNTVCAAAILWIGKLILVAVMYLVNTLPPMQKDVSDLKEDVKSLKASTATKAELGEAEKRVKAEIANEIKKAGILTQQNRRQ